MTDRHCPFCGLIDPKLCETEEESENCPHMPGHIPPDELAEIEDLI